MIYTKTNELKMNKHYYLKHDGFDSIWLGNGDSIISKSTTNIIIKKNIYNYRILIGFIYVV